LVVDPCLLLLAHDDLMVIFQVHILVCSQWYFRSLQTK